jgi:hypothetical protein
VVTTRSAFAPAVRFTYTRGDRVRRPLVFLIKGEIELQHHVQDYTSEGQ